VLTSSSSSELSSDDAAELSSELLSIEPCSTNLTGKSSWSNVSEDRTSVGLLGVSTISFVDVCEDDIEERRLSSSLDARWSASLIMSMVGICISNLKIAIFLEELRFVKVY
jgi:hypothetical protein